MFLDENFKMNWLIKFFYITSYSAVLCFCKEEGILLNAEYCSKDDIQCTELPSSGKENNYNQYKFQEIIIY